MTYQTLKAGAIRQPNDEQRRTDNIKEGPGSYQPRFKTEHAHEFRWTRCWLAGHLILQSDLMVFEFRRPI